MTFDEALDRARNERWRRLGLLGSPEHGRHLRRRGWDPRHMVCVESPIAVERLEQLPALRSLALSGLGIDDEGARALTNLAELIELDLSDNRITARGARAIGCMFGLLVLDLRGNQIGDEGLNAIAFLPSLKWLDVGFNEIGPVGALHLARAWTYEGSVPQSIVELYLDGNRIGDQAARALIERLRERRDVDKLVLGNNGLTLLREGLLVRGDAQAIFKAYSR